MNRRRRNTATDFPPQESVFTMDRDPETVGPGRRTIPRLVRERLLRKLGVNGRSRKPELRVTTGRRR